MHLSKITLINFKNHEELSVETGSTLNGFVGQNGVGKTNLLDAIYYGLTGLPYFHRSDKYNIRDDAETGAIRLELNEDNNVTEVAVRLQNGGKKTIKVDGKVLERIADYIGRYPAIMIAPGDIDLINGRPEERRRFLDRSLSFCDKDYLSAITRYNKLLEQRNKQLRDFFEQGRFDEDLIEVLDMQMAPLSDDIYAARMEYLGQFIPLFKDYYEQIEGGNEDVDISYESHLHTPETKTAEVLRDNREADRFSQRTTAGVHKDELVYFLNRRPLRKYGSQGQIKTFLIAVNLATFDMIIEKTGKTPVLLLDDIFEKIDDARASRLMKTINTSKFGQIFVTDTDRERLEKATDSYDQDRNFINIANE